MKKQLLISLISLVCAVVLCIGLSVAWFFSPVTDIDVTTYDGDVSVTFARYNASSNAEDEEAKWEYYEKFKDDGVTISFASGIYAQNYRLIITNKGDSSCKINFSFGEMDGYIKENLCSSELVNYYLTDSDAFKALSVKQDENKVFGNNTYDLYDVFNYGGNFKGSTARLLYELRNFQYTIGETTTYVDLTNIADGTVSGDGVNLWQLSSGQTLFTCDELKPNEVITVTFTIEYTANNSSYNEYANAVEANTDYIAEVVKNAQSNSGTITDDSDSATTEGSNSGTITDDTAKEYLTAIVNKEIELLMSTTAMSFQFKPQVVVTQLPRTELS
jgi:hypothetical protein